MTDEFTPQFISFANLVATNAPQPSDMRPMIRNIRRMFRELERAGQEFLEVPGNEANLGLARISRIFRNLEDLSSRWRARFAPQAPRSEPHRSAVSDNRLEDCARSMAEAAATVGAARQDSETWIAIVREFHEQADALGQVIADTVPDLEQEFLEELNELLIAVGESE